MLAVESRCAVRSPVGLVQSPPVPTRRHLAGYAGSSWRNRLCSTTALPFCWKMEKSSGAMFPVLKDEGCGSAVSLTRVRSLVLCLIRSFCCYFCAALLDSLMLNTPFEISCLKKKYQLDLNLFSQLTSRGLSASSQPARLLPKAAIVPLSRGYDAICGTAWHSEHTARQRWASRPARGRLGQMKKGRKGM